MIPDSESTIQFRPWLDELERRLVADVHGPTLAELFQGLQNSRRQMPSAQWKRAVRDEVMSHSIRDLVHRDPMCKRSYEKPRGYAGDAVLLDYIYRKRAPDESAGIGRSVYQYAVSRPAARAVCHRRDWIAHCIDRVADRTSGQARILSVACGHLREAEQSAALQNGWLRELVALDADAESLAELERDAPAKVQPLRLSISRLLTGRTQKLGKFDFVYSAGLYDYLEEPVARRLNSCLFDLLEPGGKLLFSNFLPTVADAGFMESFMGWELILRNASELGELVDHLPEDEVREIRVYEDPFAAIGYVEVDRES